MSQNNQDQIRCRTIFLTGEQIRELRNDIAFARHYSEESLSDVTKIQGIFKEEYNRAALRSTAEAFVAARNLARLLTAILDNGKEVTL